MKIKCNLCGEPVSNEVPISTVIRAVVECPECIEKKNSIDNQFHKINLLDDFAAKAMQSLIAKTVPSADLPMEEMPDITALRAYEYANAMLKEKTRLRVLQRKT